MADFQETYHLDVWGADWDGIGEDEAAHMAALAYQLPQGSRTHAHFDRAGSHDAATQLLRLIEHELHVWLWAHTKEAQSGSEPPEPVWLAGEEERHDRMVEEAMEDARRLADRLGIGQLGGGSNG